MPVYVDDAKNPFGRLKMSHMIADSQDELFEMAEIIGLDEGWIQHQGEYKEHFDIAQTKRILAISNGAICLSQKELVRKQNLKRGVVL